MSVAGNVRETGLASVIQTIGGSKGSGVLTIRGRDATVHVRIEKGYVVTATSDLSDGLGSQLVTEGILAPCDLDGALRMQRRKKVHQPLGTLLLDLGLVAREDLERGVESYVKDILVDVIGWDEGEFEYRPRGEEACETVTLVPEALRIDTLLLGVLVLLGHSGVPGAVASTFSFEAADH